MDAKALNEPERRIWEAFSSGGEVDLSNAEDSSVRAEVIRALLLGSQQPEPGCLPGLLLHGAHIKGHLALAFAEVNCPVVLDGCVFDDSMDFGGARLRRLSLRGSTFPGLSAVRATVDGDLDMVGCRSSGEVQLVGARIAGGLLLDGAHVRGPDVALDGSLLEVAGDVIGHNGFTCSGTLRLLNARVAGALRLEGATIYRPGGVALDARNLTVGTLANCCDGFRADGEMTFIYAKVHNVLCLEDAHLSNPDGTALNCRFFDTDRLILRPAPPIRGGVDLRHARIELIEDESTRWPERLHFDGLVYQRIWDVAQSDVGSAGERLRWLQLDADRHLPLAFAQLAGMYRRIGRESDARTILLADHRQRRRLAPPLDKIWGYIQDWTIGYGYRPVLAAGWLVGLLLFGTVLFGIWPPRPSATVDAPEFNPAVYTLDLLLPIVDFGQERSYIPGGLEAWVGYGLIAAGWVLATTIAAGAARILRRE